MAKKIYVLDTSVYLTDCNSIFSYGNGDVYVPLVVLEELDNNKKRPNGVGANARGIIRTLDELRNRGSFQKHQIYQNFLLVMILIQPIIKLLPPHLHL